MWLPFANQAVIVLVIGYNLLKGDTDVSDGILAFVVGLIFVALLGFLWVSEQRTVASMKADQENGGAPPSRPNGPPA
jgi:hypothetical protein